MKPTKENPVIAWFSGGVTSAVTCKICIEEYGSECVRIVFIDTHNEDEDTYRFLNDCAKWYNIEIETISAIGGKYKSIKDVWIRFLNLNVASGAICSSELKRDVGRKFSTSNSFFSQAFGFDINEPNRAKGMELNNPDRKPIFPLIQHKITKTDCIAYLESARIKVPRAYKWGFHNNNCLKTGCIQGGIGYWQLIRRTKPDLFDQMADLEHELTDLKRKPVTMLRSRSKKHASTGTVNLFLKPHPDYPDYPDISEKVIQEPKPLLECNGFCGSRDLEDRNTTEDEILFQTDLFGQKTDFLPR